MPWLRVPFLNEWEGSFASPSPTILFPHHPLILYTKLDAPLLNILRRAPSFAWFCGSALYPKQSSSLARSLCPALSPWSSLHCYAMQNLFKPFGRKSRFPEILIKNICPPRAEIQIPWYILCNSKFTPQHSHAHSVSYLLILIQSSNQSYNEEIISKNLFTMTEDANYHSSNSKGQYYIIFMCH